MATLIQLYESGVLAKIDPLTGSDDLPWRSLYATKEFVEWLDQDLEKIPHHELSGDLSPTEQVSVLLFEYVSGEFFSDDRRFKKLNWTPEHFVWEFKTDDVRIFGWVPEKDSFVCCYGDWKDQIVLDDSYGRYLAQTVYQRNRLNLDEPKYVNSRNYLDVISVKN